MVKIASFIANSDWLLEFPNQDEQIGDAWITDPDKSLPAQLGLLHDMDDVWFDTCVSLKPQLLYLVASMELQQMPIIFTVRFLRCVVGICTTAKSDALPIAGTIFAGIAGEWFGTGSSPHKCDANIRRLGSLVLFLLAINGNLCIHVVCIIYAYTIQVHISIYAYILPSSKS